MERTLAVLALLAVAGLAAGSPRPTLHLLGGRHLDRHLGLLGHIINSTADVLLKPLSFLGAGGHHGGSARPDGDQGGGITIPSEQPNSHTNTYRPISEGIPLDGGHQLAGGGNSFITGGGNSEQSFANGFNNGNGGQTSGTTQKTVELAIHEIFGNGPQSSTPTNPGGHVSNPVHGGPNTLVSGLEESTPSAVDIAIQEIFGGGGNGGNFDKPSHNGSGSSSPANHNEEVFGGGSNLGSSQNGEHKQTTSNPIDVAIHDVFGGSNTNNVGTTGIYTDKPNFPGTYGGSSGNSEFNSKPSSDTDLSSGGTPSPVDLAILEVFGRDQEAGQRVPNTEYLVVTP